MLGKEVTCTPEGVTAPSKQEPGHTEVLGFSASGAFGFGLQSKACSLKSAGSTESNKERGNECASSRPRAASAANVGSLLLALFSCFYLRGKFVFGIGFSVPSTGLQWVSKRDGLCLFGKICRPCTSRPCFRPNLPRVKSRIGERASFVGHPEHVHAFTTRRPVVCHTRPQGAGDTCWPSTEPCAPQPSGPSPPPSPSPRPRL